jgi:hypothetical protein
LNFFDCWTHPNNEFVSSSASLIRNHFTCIFFEAADRLEVRSNS